MCDGAKAIVQPSIDFDIQIVQMTLRPPKLEQEVAPIGHHNKVELSYEEKSENQEGCGNTHPKAGRLLQESEESRHALSEQRKEEVAAQTAPSHQPGGYIATRTRSNNPEGAS